MATRNGLQERIRAALRTDAEFYRGIAELQAADEQLRTLADRYVAKHDVAQHKETQHRETQHRETQHQETNRLEAHRAEAKREDAVRPALLAAERRLRAELATQAEE